jgi:hypothetical protein
MKKLITLSAIAGMVLALAPAVHAQITIMSPTVNNGSFEDWTGSGYQTNPGVIDHAPWSFNTVNGGLWRDANAAREGDVGMQINGGTAPYAEAYTYDLLTSGDSSGAYSTVSEGDVFTYYLDWKINDGDPRQTHFEIHFGGMPVVLGTRTGGSTGGWQTFSGTYTATATDAAGGTLSINIYSEGNGACDNAQLSVVGGGPAATPGTLIYAK